LHKIDTGGVKGFETAQINPEIGHKVLAAIRPLETILQKHQTVVPCHKDLHSNNVLYDGKKVYFIDWELGTNCDPHLDLATASLFFIFDAVKEKTFLKQYFGGEPTPEQNAYFFLMKQVTFCFFGCRLLRAVCGIRKKDLSKDDIATKQLPTFRDFALENYNGCSKSFTTDELSIFPFMYLREAMNGINSPQFKQSIDVLQPPGVAVTL
jgi:hypothetical protein